MDSWFQPSKKKEHHGEGPDGRHREGDQGLLQVLSYSEVHGLQLMVY